VNARFVACPVLIGLVAGLTLAIPAYAEESRDGIASAGSVVATPAPSTPSTDWFDQASPPAYSGGPPEGVVVDDKTAGVHLSYWSTNGAAPAEGQPDLSINNLVASTSERVDFNLDALDLPMRFVDAQVLDDSTGSSILIDGAFQVKGDVPLPTATVDEFGRVSVTRPIGYGGGATVAMQVALLGTDGYRYVAQIESVFGKEEQVTQEPAPIPPPPPSSTPRASTAPTATPTAKSELPDWVPFQDDAQSTPDAAPAAATSSPDLSGLFLILVLAAAAGAVAIFAGAKMRRQTKYDHQGRLRDPEAAAAKTNGDDDTVSQGIWSRIAELALGKKRPDDE